MAQRASVAITNSEHRIGLGDWMSRVADLVGKVGHGWDPDDVHDLRTAIRRCRAMADALSEVNPDAGWRKLKKSTRKLFRALGELRDSHVKLETLKELFAASDPVRKLVARTIQGKMALQQKDSERALKDFTVKDWRKLSKKLSGKAQFFPLESVVFQRLALSQLNQAVALYEFARKRRSRVAWHRLRIGLKQFRYTLENFAPARGSAWLGDLKRMQDHLGEIHDLDVLRREVLRHKAKLTPAQVEHALDSMQIRRKKILDEFLSRVQGSPSIWQTWRAGFRSVPTLQLAPEPSPLLAHSAS
jgi:CHAD domain-containing protein